MIAPSADAARDFAANDLANNADINAAIVGGGFRTRPNTSTLLPSVGVVLVLLALPTLPLRVTEVFDNPRPAT